SLQEICQRLAFFTYPLREKWVTDALAYKRSVNVSHFSHTHFVRSGYEMLEPCIEQCIGCLWSDRPQPQRPTSHEVGMQRRTRFLVGDNITFPLLTKWVFKSVSMRRGI